MQLITNHIQIDCGEFGETLKFPHFQNATAKYAQDEKESSVALRNGPLTVSWQLISGLQLNVQSLVGSSSASLHEVRK